MGGEKKRCFKCKRLQSVEAFYRHSAMADGRLGKCIECTKADSAARFQTKREEIRAYDAQRARRPNRRKKVQQYMRNGRARYPERYRARTAVGNAIRDGRLQRQPCEECGAPAQAHHEDYGRPLDVRWLCFRHHRKVHGQRVG